MTKKKNSSSNSSLSELRFSDLIRFIINLPKKEQEDFLQLMDKVENMPEKEREHALSNLMFGTMLGMDLEQFKNPEKLQQPMMENLIGSDSTEYSYPHFLPRQKVEKYTLRVTLLGFKPSIYRKFNVPSNITLRHLSEHNSLLLTHPAGGDITSCSPWIQRINLPVRIPVEAQRSVAGTHHTHKDLKQKPPREMRFRFAQGQKKAYERERKSEDRMGELHQGSELANGVKHRTCFRKS